MRSELVESLKRHLGEDKVLTERSDLVPYCSDYQLSSSFESSGDWPLCVVLPETTDEVSSIVKLAVEHKAPIVPRGGGSNQVGAVVPNQGSIVLSTAKMNRVIDIDTVNMTVTAQPGVGLSQIDDALEPHGLLLAQEQGSYKTANIGGAVSTNGFSLKHRRYGNIGDNVLSLEVVLGDGRIMRTGPKVCQNSSGYHLHKLFVGAEGTLGIITELTLRVMPTPEKEWAIAATFDTWDRLQETIWKFLKSGVNYTGGDGFAFKDVKERWEYYLLFGLEGTKEEVDAQERVIRRILLENGGKLIDSEIAWSRWRETRVYWCGTPHPTLAKNDLVITLPLQEYDKVHARVEKEVFPKYGFKMDENEYKIIVLGKRILVTLDFVYDPKKVPLEKLRKVYGEMMKIVAEHGGSGPGCHGVGIMLRDYIAYEYEPVTLELMKSVKKLFDPHDIMNPGKKLPT